MNVEGALYLGWDVGAWHCKPLKGKSCDALVVLRTSHEGELSLAGSRRDNMRELLAKYSGNVLIREMVHFCGVEIASGTHLTIAIDTPLGWPRAMIDLVTEGRIGGVPATDGQNAYTRRETELALVRERRQPLSTVRDQIGSQSTKAIHFLHAAHLQEKSPGVWEGGDGAKLRVRAIETYPAVVQFNKKFEEQHQTLLTTIKSASKSTVDDDQDDEEDALTCALVAYLFALGAVSAVPECVPRGEGWIMRPKT
jgi:hypothetical protein